MTEARENANTCARVLGELLEQAKLPFDQEWPTLRPTLELGTHLRQWPTIGHSLDQFSSQISSSLERIGTFTQFFPPSNGIANIDGIAQALGSAPRTGHFTQVFSALDGITNINSIVQELVSPLVDMPPLPVIRIDDRFIAQGATRDALTMRSPNASPEEQSAAWESMDLFVREWLHIEHVLPYQRFSGTYRVTRNGGRVNIRTTADCTFANSNLLELTAKELVSGRWVISDSPRDYLHVAVTKEVRRYLNSQEEEQRVLQTTEGLSLEGSSGILVAGGGE